MRRGARPCYAYAAAIAPRMDPRMAVRGSTEQMDLISHNRIRYAIASLAAVGAALMGYLAYLQYSGATSAVCDLSEGLSCSSVTASAYSEVLGVPLSVLGILYFLSIAVMMTVPIWPDPFRDTILFTVFSLFFGAYLSGVELFVLGSFCLFCETSKLVMLAILALAVTGARSAGERLHWSWLASAVLVGVLFSGGSYMLQREPSPLPAETSSVSSPA